MVSLDLRGSLFTSLGNGGVKEVEDALDGLYKENPNLKPDRIVISDQDAFTFACCDGKKREITIPIPGHEPQVFQVRINAYMAKQWGESIPVVEESV